MAGPSQRAALALLFSCVGRRVELLQAFRAAAARLHVDLTLIGTDFSATAPALACVDVPVITPGIGEPGYAAALLALVRRCGARALIPTIDPDLPVLCAQHAALRALGCEPLIADPRVIGICNDKLETHAFLRGHGFDTPDTFAPDQLPPPGARRFPYFLKPRSGSASVGAHRIEDERDLQYYLAKVDRPIVQEFVAGHEHTLDVYVGLRGEPRCVVPRLRWATRGGEVVKGVVVKDAEIMEAGRRVVAALGSSVRGLVTLQCILTPERRIRFIEINPRFGGGAPLGIAAGADYPGWLLEELLGRTPAIAMDGFRDGVSMLRYDWSVFAPFEPAQGLGRPLRPFPRFE